ncbi:unnamed protein product [Adineta steineri]|uniref:B box-type domain-containing protein n=2 Tax=Adineta steineri TaxID=433720 RepID=A0A814LWK5_9BILA|nr:unnamed protein product [Adineta steineri]
MASATESTKILCIICNKGKGIFKCEGCSQIFCPKHSIDHRNELSKQLEEITVTHDLIQQTLVQQTEDPQQHPLIQKVDQWEKESIVKIRQLADKVKNDLCTYTTEHTTLIKHKLKQISIELRQSGEDSDFSEIDLQRWTQKLEELRQEFLSPSTITLRENFTPYITSIYIDRHHTFDVFERVYGVAEIKENGNLTVQSDRSGRTEIRGRNEYTSGRHKLRFRIEQFDPSGWISVGIISKAEPMGELSYESPFSYGWSNKDQVWIAGQWRRQQTIQILQNETIELLIDCNKAKIELKNERLERTKELSIDLTKCPFPWQFYVNLYTSNTQVRILPSSN